MTLFRNVFEPNQPKYYQYPKSKKGKDEFHSEIPNQDLPEMMSSNLKNERKNNQDLLLKILSSIQFLGKFILYPI